MERVMGAGIQYAPLSRCRELGPFCLGVMQPKGDYRSGLSALADLHDINCQLSLTATGIGELTWF